MWVAVVIPQQCIILLAGFPATGKSTFGQYLAREHGFAHYNLECDALSWPCPNLKGEWDSSRQAFVSALKERHHRVVLDWGFPVHYLSWVNELLSAGVKVVWFSGNLLHLRRVFIARGRGEVAQFDAQVRAIQEAGLPGSLCCISIVAITGIGAFLDTCDIERLIFDSTDQPARTQPGSILRQKPRP